MNEDDMKSDGPNTKRQRLLNAGWKEGDAKEFLGLTNEEIDLVEKRRGGDDYGIAFSSPEGMEILSAKIDRAIKDIECDVDEEAFGPMSGQHYLLALGAMKQARRFMELALYYRRRGD